MKNKNKIQRVTYRNHRGQAMPYRKKILTRITNEHYLIQEYGYDRITEQWYDHGNSSHLDKNLEPQNGVLMYSHNVDKLFELKTLFEGFEYVEEDSINEQKSTQDANDSSTII